MLHRPWLITLGLLLLPVGAAAQSPSALALPLPERLLAPDFEPFDEPDPDVALNLADVLLRDRLPTARPRFGLRRFRPRVTAPIMLGPDGLPFALGPADLGLEDPFNPPPAALERAAADRGRLLRRHQGDDQEAEFLVGFGQPGRSLPEGDGQLHRLDLLVRGPAWDLGGGLVVRGCVGLRTAGFEPRPCLEGAAEDRPSLFRAGPQFGVDWQVPLGDPGLMLFGRVEGAALVGDARPATADAEADGAGFQPAVPGAAVVIGVGGQGDRLRWAAGYHLEQTWLLGRGGNRPDVGSQGLFVWLGRRF
jgi:hypothetical protein